MRSAWSAVRRTLLQREYRTRRERYAALAQQRALSFDEAHTVASVRSRISARGYTVERKALGSVHTLAFVPEFGWHRHLMPDLHELGKVTRFDYSTLGFELPRLRQCDRVAVRDRETLSRAFIDLARETHAREPIDWVFVYANGSEISSSAIRRIVSEIGVPVVNMCLDDKHSWIGPRAGDQHSGQVDIACEFDMSWTSSRVACEWYLVEGARPIYLPEGFDASAYAPSDDARDIAVSFVGAAYGYRVGLVKLLREHGIPVRVFGAGWSDAHWAPESVKVFNRSRINLGMGGIGYSEALTTVKGRDFEVTGTGGGLYVTSYNADLAQHFVIGSEIICYGSRDELIELLRYYLQHEDQARAAASRARERSLREHRWLHRYVRVCEILRVL